MIFLQRGMWRWAAHVARRDRQVGARPIPIPRAGAGHRASGHHLPPRRHGNGNRRHGGRYERLAQSSTPPHRAGCLSLRPTVIDAPSHRERREHAAAIRSSEPGDRSRLARRADHRHRQRPGRVWRVSIMARRIPALGERRRDGARRHRHGAGGIPPGAQQCRLASPAGDLRPRRYAHSRRGRRVRPGQLQRPAPARPQGNDERGRTPHHQGAAAWGNPEQGAPRRVSLSAPDRLRL